MRLKTGKSKIIVYEVRYFDRGEDVPSYYKKRWGSPNYKKRYLPGAGWYIRFGYGSSVGYNEAYMRKHRKWRQAEDFEPYDPQLKIKLEAKMAPVDCKPKLYQTKAEPIRYGTFLTMNSVGQMVLEMKGENGKCEPFEEDALEVVTPHTIELTRIGLSHEEKRGVCNSCHIVSKKSQVSVNDVLLEMNTGIIWRVTKVDSKCLSPRENKSKWMKIPAEFVILGEQ